jgi:Leucine-rich repeat (LRR) protein
MVQLTQMPSLEILDMSKNQISAFPDTPGRLIYLKVLSLTHNKLYALPPYMVDFPQLKVFKVDGNPVQWPVSRDVWVMGAGLMGRVSRGKCLGP